DLVYSPEGVIGGLGDLDAWATGLDGALHPRGELLVFDDHPVALCVDGLQRWHYDYFEEGFWRLGRIVTSLVRAGFRIEALEEYPGERRVPGTFLLYARREGVGGGGVGGGAPGHACRMGIATSLFLVGGGAILAFAVPAH